MSKSIGLALFLEGNYRFSLFYLVFEGNFQVQVLGGGGGEGEGGAYIWRGVSTEGFLRYDFIGLVFGGSYTWRG